MRLVRSQHGRVSILLTLIILLILGSLGYTVWRFVPVYLGAWEVDSVLATQVAQVYRINRLNEPRRSEAEHTLVDETRTKIEALGISDPELAVTLDYQGESVLMRCDYRIELRHPFLLRPTQLQMHRSAKSDLRSLAWE